MGKGEEASDLVKMSAPITKEDYDFVKRANGVRNSPAFCRVPGDLPPLGKMNHELQNLRNEMKKKSLLELKDLLSSTRKIAQNQILLNKLPDRGAKVKQKMEVLESLVKEREAGEDLATCLANLKLPDTTAMEWSTKSTVMSVPEPVTAADKTLKVLSEGVVPGDQQEEDYLDKSGSTCQYLSQKVQVLDTVPKKDRFIPVSSLHNSELTQVKSKLSTPVSTQSSSSRLVPKVKTEPIPLPKYSSTSTKQLTLQESLSIQREQAEKLREATVRQAAARLAAKSSANKTGKETASSASSATVQTIVDTRWRDTTAADSDEEEVGDAGLEVPDAAAAQQALLDSDDDSEQEFHDAQQDQLQ